MSSLVSSGIWVQTRHWHRRPFAVRFAAIAGSPETRRASSFRCPAIAASSVSKSMLNSSAITGVTSAGLSIPTASSSIWKLFGR